jgi:hypothetical protein
MVAMLGTLRERINSQSVSVLAASTSRPWVAAGSDVLCYAPNARTLNSPPFCTCFDSGPSRHDNANGSALLWYCPSFLCVMSELTLYVPACVTRCPRADAATKQAEAPEAGGSSSGRAISTEGRDPCRACMSSFCLLLRGAVANAV